MAIDTIFMEYKVLHLNLYRGQLIVLYLSFEASVACLTITEHDGAIDQGHSGPIK